MLLVIDNYDSFTFNLVQLLGTMGENPVVVRNDEHTVAKLALMKPERVVVSPGPCTPRQAGVSIETFRTFGRVGIPMLGVCLGHQALGEAFGGRTVRASRVMHGMTDRLVHTGSGIFRGIPSPFVAARYHSLVTDARSLPEELVPVAWSEGAGAITAGLEIQAMHHRTQPLWGVQFHPESLFSEYGDLLLRNFLAIA